MKTNLYLVNNFFTAYSACIEGKPVIKVDIITLLWELLVRYWLLMFVTLQLIEIIIIELSD